mgnify:CR=1 FL=1
MSNYERGDYAILPKDIRELLSPDTKEAYDAFNQRFMRFDLTEEEQGKYADLLDYIAQFFVAGHNLQDQLDIFAKFLEQKK